MTIDIATIGTPLLNTRQENFCLELAGGVSQTEAYRRAGYSFKSARWDASTLMTKPYIIKRLEELQIAVQDASIMGIIERKARLSEIGRARLCHYQNKHGVLDPFSPDSPNPGARAQVEQEFDYTGLRPFPTKIKLHDPVKAIDILNKMEGSYPPARLEVTGHGGGPIKVEDTRARLTGLIVSLSTRIGDTAGHPELKPG